MPDTQAQAEDSDTQTVSDPLDAENTQNNGTNELAAYEAEVAAALAEVDETDSSEQQEDVEEDSEQEEQEEQESEEADSEAGDDDTDELDEVPEVKTRDRFRFKGAEDQAVALLAKTTGKSLVEAALAYANLTKAQDSTSYDEEVPVDTVAKVTEEIKSLQAQKREKMESLEFADAALLDEQIDELRDKRDELRVSEVQEKTRTAQASEAKFYSDYDKSQSAAVGFYPDAAGAFDSKSDKAQTPLAKRMIAIDAQMRELGDPLYHSEKKPLILAKQAAVDLGIPMRKPGSVQVKKSVQNRPIQPASGNARTTSGNLSKALDMEIDGMTSLEAYERKFRRG